MLRSACSVTCSSSYLQKKLVNCAPLVVITPANVPEETITVSSVSVECAFIVFCANFVDANFGCTGDIQRSGAIEVVSWVGVDVVEETVDVKES